MAAWREGCFRTGEKSSDQDAAPTLNPQPGPTSLACFLLPFRSHVEQPRKNLFGGTKHSNVELNTSSLKM